MVPDIGTGAMDGCAMEADSDADDVNADVAVGVRVMELPCGTTACLVCVEGVSVVVIAA